MEGRRARRTPRGNRHGRDAHDVDGTGRPRRYPFDYGLEGLAAGWVVHLFHSVVLGVVFAGLAGSLGFGESVGRSVGLGVAYGAVLWVVLAALVMPVWLGAVGSPANPPLPNFNPMSLVGHLAYGLVLGVAFLFVRDL